MFGEHKKVRSVLRRAASSGLAFPIGRRSLTGGFGSNPDVSLTGLSHLLDKHHWSTRIPEHEWACLLISGGYIYTPNDC